MLNINELIKLTDEPRIIGALQALEVLQRSQMQPAVKFLGNTILQQHNQVWEEFGEALHELVDLVDNKDIEAKPRALDELNDVEISIETLKAIIEPDESKRRESMIKTIAKNDARGYYKAE